MASVHVGHRERLKRQFCEKGIESMSDYQILELLLFFSIPQKDTNPIAHGLMEHFGSLSRVMEAPIEELEKVPGVGHQSALLIHLVTEAGRAYLVDRVRSEKYLLSTEKCGAYLTPFFFGRTVETVFLLCLDAKCKVLGCKLIGEGSINFASLSTRKVVETALGLGATSVVLAHNHPSGLALPSSEDVHTTLLIAEALKAVEVRLVDHIVVADGDYVSLAESGYISID